MPTRPTSLVISESLEAILIAINTYQYLTAGHVSRLLYPGLRDKDRYAQRNLKKLEDAGYLLRLRALTKPRQGSEPHVFTLARRGRQYLTQLGIETPGYFRPSEEPDKAWRPFMRHTLAAIDVLIAAELLTRQVDYVTRPRMVSERELKRQAAHVDVPASPASPNEGTRRVAVIPDGWFQLSIGGRSPYSLSLELDRGTEEQKHWRRKAAALVYWAIGPYKELFETDNVTFIVVTTSRQRRDQLRAWTLRELTLRQLGEYGELFLFTSADPAAAEPEAFFFAPVWYGPDVGPALPLLERPQHLPREETPYIGV